MTSRVLDLKLSRPTKPKRVYSKGGCRECKRRKIKCDEAKPHCWQCARLKKECSYPAAGEKVIRGPKTLLDDFLDRKSVVPRSDALPSSHSYPDHIVNQNFGHGKSHSAPKKVHLHPYEGVRMAALQSNGSYLPSNHNSPSFHFPQHPFTPSGLQHAYYGQPPPAQFAQQVQMPMQTPLQGPFQVPPQVPFQATFPVLVQAPFQAPPAPPQPLQTPQQTPQPTPVEQPPQPARQIILRPNIVNLLNEDTNGSYRSPLDLQSESTQDVTPRDDEIFQLFDQDDLSVLATDLNNIVKGIFFESNFDKNKEDKTNSEQSSLIDDASSFGVNASVLQSPLASPPRNIPFNYINLTKSHERRYLQEFYDNFSSIILPFNSFDAITKEYFNPARDIILRVSASESFLLAAILAHGARTAHKENKSTKDEEAYCLYLSKCLELLGPALAENERKRLSGGSLTSNVEAVLVTVLLLTAANASNSLQNWRPHLQGAKDILLKNSNQYNKASKVFIFCKNWFVALEILAGISSKMGGTLTTDEEIDSIVNSGSDYEVSILKEIGIILDNGFSIMCGYHYKCIDQFGSLIKLLNRRREYGKQNPGMKYVPEPSFAYIKLLSEFYEKSEIEFINKKCIMSTKDFPNDLVPTGYLIEYIKPTETVVSWQDTSHQAYVVAAIIKILNDFFSESYSSPQVQFLCGKLTALVSFLRKDFDIQKQLMKCSLMMLLWPMFVAGINCDEEAAKSLLLNYFELSAEAGSGGALFAYERINKIWDRRKKGLNDEDEDDEEGVDLVSY